MGNLMSGGTWDTLAADFEGKDRQVTSMNLPNVKEAMSLEDIVDSIGTPSREDGTNCVVLDRLCPADCIFGTTTPNKEAITEDQEEEGLIDQEEIIVSWVPGSRLGVETQFNTVPMVPHRFEADHLGTVT